MKKALVAIAIIILVVVGWIIVSTYPRHINMSLKGVEYKLGSPQQGVKPVTLKLHGTLHRPLWGRRTFDGTVNILGATFPNKANGKPLEIPFDKNLGGQITYFDTTAQKFYIYGVLYPDKDFSRFTITEYQHDGQGSGWSGADGLMISAPAKTRKQALQISNQLMKPLLLPGHPLK